MATQSIDVLLAESITAVLAAITRLSPVEVTTTTYTLSPADNGKFLYFTNAAGCVVTIPDMAVDDLLNGFYCTGIQRGAVAVSFVKQNVNDELANADGATETETVNATFSLSRFSDDGTNAVYLLDGRVV